MRFPRRLHLRRPLPAHRPALPLRLELRTAQWVRRRLGVIDHEWRVARLASLFFSLTRKWHNLSPSDEKLLRLSALVHDVGRAIADDGHHKLGARMLLDADLPIDDSIRTSLAYLTRFHRGRDPEPSLRTLFDRPLDHPRQLRILLSLLRAADALDSRSLTPPHLLATTRGRTLTIYGCLHDDARSFARLARKRKKFSLLESTLDCEVRTEWFAAERLTSAS